MYKVKTTEIFIGIILNTISSINYHMMHGRYIHDIIFRYHFLGNLGLMGILSQIFLRKLKVITSGEVMDSTCS